MSSSNNSKDIINKIDIESSYKVNNLGAFLYDLVFDLKPKKIVEFGTLYGYSAICMGLALKDLGKGKLVCYDLWDSYEFKSEKLRNTEQTVKKFKLENYVSLEKGNLFKDDWSLLEFDLCHIDVSNDGEKIVAVRKIFEKKINEGIPVIFEGGTPERDEVPWMNLYGKKKIEDVKNIVSYEVINKNWPGISKFSK